MAIDRIPGVGPANADIAATIATTPAVSSQITASVPTAAAIATAVAAPSAATIAAAVAAPSAATIAAAVAAPSAATITAAGTAAGFANTGGETWTLISTINTTSGASEFTFSSLSGYKTYKIVFSNVGSASVQNFYIRLNGVTSAGSYNFIVQQLQGSTWDTNGSNSQGSGYLGEFPKSQVLRWNGYLIASQANLTGAKVVELKCYSNPSSGNPVSWEGMGQLFSSNAAITSILFGFTGSAPVVGTATLYGGN